MRIAFYIKILIAFLLFATLLLALFFVMSKNLYENHYASLSSKTFSNVLTYRKHIFENLLEKKRDNLKQIATSKAFKHFVHSNSETLIQEQLSHSLKNNELIMHYEIIDKFGTLLLNVKKTPSPTIHNSTITTHSLSQEEHYALLKLENKGIWVSSIAPELNNNNTANGVNVVLKMAIKVNDYYIIAFINAKKLLIEHFTLNDYQSYVIARTGHFLLHPNALYNWSEFFNPQMNIKKTFAQDYMNIVNNERFENNRFMTQKIHLDASNSIILLVEFDNSLLAEFKNANNIMIILGIVFSIILALLFSNPIAKLNEELEKEKENLNLSNIQNEGLLDDSLALIDKYVMYIKFDLQHTISDVSACFCDVSGYNKQELIGQNYKILIENPNDLEAIYSTLEKANVYSGEIKNVKKFGELFWLASNYEPNFDSQKNIISYTAMCSNISYQKKIHSLYNDLNNQIEQLNAIFQNAHSGIALLNYECKFENINTAFCNLLGYGTDELLKKDIFSIIVNNQEAFLKLMVNQAKEFGSMTNLEVIMLSKNNEYIHLNISLSALPDKSHIVLVANSLEDKRKLQELNSNLEQRVKQEVSKNVAQEKMHQEQQIKNAKLTSIGTLAAGITHEINTPLTYLKGNFEMMQYDIEDLPDSSIKTNMQSDSEKITEAINRISNIVESMREMSQTSSEAKDKTNVYATLITSLTMAYNRSKQISKIYLNNELFDINSINKNAYEYFVMAQKQRIEQVWVIIINNALDELHKIENYEHRVLHINIIENPNEIMVCFKDNAGGIKEDIIDTIFEPFTSSKVHSGMGVGLNIAKKIIEEQDATIEAHNEKNGAVFEVTFKK